MPSQATAPIQLDQDSYKTQIIEAGGVAAVDFWAPWCQPCKILGPTIDRLAERFAGKATIAKLDVDEVQSVAVEHGITSIPAVLIFKDGKVVDRAIGLVDEEVLAGKIEAQL